MLRRSAVSIPFFLLLFVAISRTQSPDAAARRWYKGNLHTHTLNSDGDSTPLDVATWYREHGYQFLVLSDHNFFTEVGGLNSVIGAKEKFLLIAGEEVTDSFEKKPIHVNGFNLAGLVEPQHGSSVAATIQSNVDAVRNAGALPSLNHPSFRWGVTIDDMLKVRGLTHFEVYNGHPQVNNLGGGGVPSLEQMWDTLLTAGARLNGVAVDDAHHFKRIGKEFSNPGRGWVSVRAEALTPEAIVQALAQGEFYASTGVTLRDVRITEREYALDIPPSDIEKTTTYFVGAGGKVLATSSDSSPRYEITGDEKYVRARVESSNGATAWTMPVFLGHAPSAP